MSAIHTVPPTMQQHACVRSLRQPPAHLRRAARKRSICPAGGRMRLCQCSSFDGSSADIAAAWSLLKTFSEQQFKGRAQPYLGSASSRAKLRDALLLVYQHPSTEESWNPASNPEVLMGVMASEGRLAVRALRDWCQALQLTYVQPDCRVTEASSIAGVQGSVYIKYNSTREMCYLTKYQGTERGVLLQLGAGSMLGCFPLGFFDEGMENPEPSAGQGAAAASSS